MDVFYERYIYCKSDNGDQISELLRENNQLNLQIQALKDQSLHYANEVKLLKEENTSLVNALKVIAKNIPSTVSHPNLLSVDNESGNNEMPNVDKPSDKQSVSNKGPDNNNSSQPNNNGNQSA